MGGRYQFAVRDAPYALAAVGLLGLVTLISAGIITRNIELDVGGLQTISQLIGVWLAFVVAGGLAQQRRHIEIDYFSARLPAGVRSYHSIAVGVLSLALSVVLFLGGLIAMNRFWDSTATNAPIPIPVYYAAITIGGLLLSAVYWNQLVETIGFERGRFEHTADGDEE